MGTKIRSSQQLYIDADLEHNGKKGINLAPGTIGTDAVNKSQMDSAISNAVSGVGNAIHVPVADLAASKAVPSAGRSDKMIMLVETLGLYRFDAESMAVSNEATVIRPTDVASDAVSGRWVKMSSAITDHDLLSNIVGNGQYHLSLAERDKLTNIEALADVTDAANVGSSINGTTAKATPVDADAFSIINSVGSVLAKVTWASIKATLKAYFDTLYNLYVHPNHSGDVTSVADGATTIVPNAVTNAKAAQMATMTIKGNNTGATANAADLTVAQLKTMLGLNALNISTQVTRATPVGTVNGSLTDFTLPNLVISGTEHVYKNGLLMNAGAGNDYTIVYGATTTITFLTAPSNTPFVDTILVSYRY
jgi:hypothetical protein